MLTCFYDTFFLLFFFSVNFSFVTAVYKCGTTKVYLPWMWFLFHCVIQKPQTFMFLNINAFWGKKKHISIGYGINVWSTEWSNHVDPTNAQKEGPRQNTQMEMCCNLQQTPGSGIALLWKENWIQVVGNRVGLDPHRKDYSTSNKYTVKAYGGKISSIYIKT